MYEMSQKPAVDLQATVYKPREPQVDERTAKLQVKCLDALA